MIKINGTDAEWQPGMTVASLLSQKRYIYARIIVKLNGRVIEKDDYPTTAVNDGDEIQAIHLLAGG